MASGYHSIELDRDESQFQEALMFEGIPSQALALHDPSEPSSNHRRPLPSGSQDTVQQPLLHEQPPPHHQSSGLGPDSENFGYGHTENKATHNYMPTQSATSFNHASDLKYNHLEAHRVPKQITRTSLARYFNGWLVHIPAVLLTAITIWVSTKRWFWYPEEGLGRGITAEVIGNILQFVAKIHELLIVASLSSIAIAMFRRQLVGDGLRLGLLTGGYRVGDIGYLMSSPFRCQGLNGTMPWDIFLVVYIVFATLLSTVVGPASAVLIVPTSGWFSLKHPKAFSDLPMPLIYWASSNEAWPQHLKDGRLIGNEILENNKCKTTEGLYISECPTGGYSEIWNWAASHGSTSLENVLTFNHPSTELRRHLVFTQALNATILLTTPSHFLLKSLGLFQKYITSNHVGTVSNGARHEFTAKRKSPDNNLSQLPIYQPFVQSRCRIYNKEEVRRNNNVLYYPTEELNCLGDEKCEKLKKDPPTTELALESDDNKTTSMASSYFVKIDNSPIVLTYGLVASLPEHREEDMIYACSMFARWVSSGYSIDAKVSDVLRSTLNDKERMKDVFQSRTPYNGDIMPCRFNNEWLKYLDISFDNAVNNTMGQSTNSPTSSLLQLADLFQGGDDATDKSITSRNHNEAEVILAKVFGAHLTDGLSRTGPQRSTILKRSVTKDRLELFELDTQYGYYKGSLTIKAKNNTHSQWTRGDEMGVESWPLSLEGVTQAMNETLIQLDFDTRRYGYGTGRPRKTLTFALVIMYTYLGIATLYALSVGSAHVLELMERGRKFRVPSIVPWADLQDLLILALKTPPPRDADLADAGAGVSSKRAWRTLVRARADSQQNVQLVLDDETTTKKLDLTGTEKYY
ncbi:uncharacterized protein CTRU02_204288 [Colletotrichum truncatum]|uniref:Uncharacterized protein n=1 Tax=Colletotrichum truncatum TaxID=5467 RepID=A0ACC3ZBN9_COLTU|nr:uncharacterized protein CTRU02_10140 [Colletotrichum truncatum]KAF6787845.1 hypothetical protein CTRU02_10140 [Colletotrichum truncatum]